MITMTKKNENETAGFVITNPLTGKPVRETPDGVSIEGKVFATKKDLVDFVDKHWDNAVFLSDGNHFPPPV